MNVVQIIFRDAATFFLLVSVICNAISQYKKLPNTNIYLPAWMVTICLSSLLLKLTEAPAKVLLVMNIVMLLSAVYEVSITIYRLCQPARNNYEQ